MPEAAPPWSLAEALDKRAVRLMETGSMDAAAARNFCPAPVLAAVGDTLIGGAQNRTVTAPCLIGPGREAELKTSCVEVNRWDIPPHANGEPPADKRAFRKTDIAFSGLRRLSLMQAANSLATDRKLTVDQKEIWKKIVDAFGVCGATSKTLDMHDLYEHLGPLLFACEARFFIAPNQAGLIAVVDGREWSLELFDTTDALRKRFRGLIKSCAFDSFLAEERPRAGGAAPSSEDARAMLKKIKTLPIRPVGEVSGPVSPFFVRSSLYSGLGIAAEDRLLQLSLVKN